MEAEIKYIYGLTPMQEGMLFHKLISNDATSYHNQDCVWIEEAIDLKLFKEAVQILSLKHDALGAAFVIPKSTGYPRQIFFKDRAIECEYIETAEEDYVRYVKGMKKNDLERGFDLQKDSLIRVMITYFSCVKKYNIMISHHHIIMDGWCMSIVFNDLMKYYNQLTSGLKYEELVDVVQQEKETTTNYIDYLTWLNKQDTKEGLRYWKELLQDYHSVADITPIEIPDNIEDSVGELNLELNNEEYTILRNTAKRLKISLNTIFEAAFGILLQKYNYTDDVVFGKVVSGRNVPIHGIEDTVGLFINTIPCRVSSVGDMKVSNLFEQLKKQSIESERYEYCPLFEIQKYTEQREELIKTLFNFEYDDNYDVLFIKSEATREETNYDLNMSLIAKKQVVSIKLIYNTRKFSESEIYRLLSYYKTLVVAMSQQPDNEIKNLSVLTQDAKSKILNTFNDKIIPYPRDKTMIALFLEQVKRRPNEIAIVFEETVLTYLELNMRANHIAKQLQLLGVKPRDKIIIIAEKSCEFIIGILGIIKCGAAYVPVDISYPEERRRNVIEDCCPKAILIYETTIHADIPVINLADVNYDSSVEEIGYSSGPDDLSIIYYTSGTSGKPKGVMVEQHSIINLILTCDYADLSYNTRILQAGSLAFDASTFEIWAALLHGGQLYIIKKEELLNCVAFKEYIVNHKITGIFLTVSLFNQYIMEDVSIFDSVEWILFGGEKASEECTYLLRKYNKKLIIKNMYGPTETTTFATYQDVIDTDGTLTIGKTIPNLQAYIMNGSELCGIGMVGELCLAGEGVSRGYLNKEELTNQKFIGNPFGNGKMYCTGDLVRWRADGNIEYVGRIDDQVKIRGFRIEIGDIVNAIRKIIQVKDVAILAKNNGQGEKNLCAYIVLRENIVASKIKEILYNQLPDYMVPKYINFIDKIPMTVNGKINYNALPETLENCETQYILPRNKQEQDVVNIFKEVLGVEQVSITDSFFDLGGDSIKAIRVVSKMRAASYDISVGDILKAHSVERIASTVGTKKAESYFQGEVTGRVMLTPIMKEFFSGKILNPCHYNQSILISLETDDTLMIQRVLDAITYHHDMLRVIYTGGVLEILPHELNKGYEFIHMDYLENEYFQKELEEECTRQQESMNLDKGPLMKTVLFKTVDGPFLLICIHHLVVDGVSWQILLEDISVAFSQVLSNEEITLPEKTASFKDWSYTLEEYRSSETLKAEIPFWKDITDRCSILSYENGKVKNDKTENDKNENGEFVNPKMGWDNIEASLNIDSTRLLLEKANKAFHTEVKDLLLSALVITLSNISGENEIVVGLEGHGREKIHKNVAIDRTIGWFTTIYPLIFHRFQQLEDTIMQTKDLLRGVPNHGIGYGLLKDELGDKGLPVLFNYLGEIVTNIYQNGTLSKYSTGVNVAKENVFCGLSLDCSIIDKELFVDLIFDQSQYLKETAHSIVTEFITVLEEIIDFCLNRKASVKTITDYSGIGINQQDINSINNLYQSSEIADIYTLSPMQEGMLFHSIVDRNSTNYVIQTIFKLDSNINPIKMEEALELLSKRHDVLRIIFLYTKLSRPLQIVLNDRKPEFEFIDLCHRQEDTKNTIFENMKEQDVSRGFDLEQDSVIRLKLFKLDDKVYKLIFTIHHVVVDGWSLSLLFCDLFQYYFMLDGDTTNIDIIKMIQKQKIGQGTYGEFVKLCNTRDKVNAKKYWEKLLKEYDGIAGFKPMKLPQKSKSQVEKVEYSLQKFHYDRMLQLTSQLHVTANSIIEMVLGYLLCVYNHTEDVVFGKVVSGREADIDGIENIAGLFINTIPVRFVLDEHKSMSELISSMQIQANESRLYDYYPFSDIQKMLDIGSDMIKTILVFENYYVDTSRMDEGSNSDFLFEIESDREQLNYPISFIVSIENERIHFSCLYDPNEFVKEEVEIMLQHTTYILEQVLEDPGVNASKIEIVTEHERELILTDFNDTKEIIQENLLVMDLFEQRVMMSPDNIALVFENKKLTFKELNAYANCLAWELTKYNIIPDDFVVLLTTSSVEMMIAILAVLKCGAAYVPVSPDYPEDRIQYIIDDCNPKVILCYGKKFDDKFKVPVIDLDEDIIIYNERISNPKPNTKPDNLAYCIYTSGTTGRPKGVMIEQGSIVNYVVENSHNILWEAAQLGLNKIVSITNYTFDIFLTESLFAFINNYTVYLTSEEEKQRPSSFARLCDKHEIEILQTTPSRIKAFISDKSCHHAFKNLKFILLGGEKVEWNVIQILSEITEAVFVDVYGPTEATVFATQYNINPRENFESISIGRPLANIQTYVIKKDRLCGIGIPGELYIAGNCLARGYLNNKELTDEKFVQNLFGEGKMYRTGDLAKYRQDGNLVYLGRVDEQIKIRGHRIELGEIESVLRDLAHVMDTAVVVKESSDGELILCAYLVADNTVDIEDIRYKLSEMLPDYMIPQYISQISSIPVNSSGKIDKRALPFNFTRKRKEYIAPSNDKELVLCNAICEILNINEIGMKDSFTELGGDSLKAIRLVSCLAEKGYIITLQSVVRSTNLDQMSKKISLNDFSSIANEIGRFFRNSQLEKFSKTESNSEMQDQLVANCILVSESELKRYSNECCINDMYEDYPLSGMQFCSYEMGVRSFAMQIPFCTEMNLEKLSSSWQKMRTTHDIINSSIIMEEGKERLRIYKNAEYIRFPYVDISMLDDYHKRLFILNLLDNIKYFGVNEYLTDRQSAIHTLLIKFEPERYSVYFACSHLICDGFSGDLLKENLMENYFATDNHENKYSYENTIRFMENKYVDISEDNIVKELELESFVEKVQVFESILETMDLKKECIEIRTEEKWLNMSQEIRFGVAQHLFVEALLFTFPDCDIPVGMLRASRNNRKQDLFNYIGELLDITPVILKAGSNKTIEEMAYNKQIFMENHNFYFSGLFTKEAKSQSITVKETFKSIMGGNISIPSGMLIYNNTGGLGGVGSIEIAENSCCVPNILNCEVSEDKLKLNVLIENGRKGEVIKYLNTKFLAMMD